jgi:hypothetical protein
MIKMKTTTLALALSLLPIAAQAQTNPILDDMIFASVVCAQGFGDLAAMDAALVGAGWTKGEVVDGAVEYQAPEGSEETYALIDAEKGQSCNIWSASLSIDDAKTVTLAVFDELKVNVADAKLVTDAYGCEGLELPSGVGVSAVSSDDPPVCEGGSGSQLIFSNY